MNEDFVATIVYTSSFLWGYFLYFIVLQSFFTEGILRSRWEELAPTFLDYEHTADNVTEVTNKITKFYFGGNSPLTVSQSRIAAVSLRFV